MLEIIVRGKRKLFPEISDFPYAKSLSQDAYNHLKEALERDIENCYKQKKFIAMMMARKEQYLKKKAVA